MDAIFTESLMHALRSKTSLSMLLSYLDLLIISAESQNSFVCLLLKDDSAQKVRLQNLNAEILEFLSSVD